MANVSKNVLSPVKSRPPKNMVNPNPGRTVNARTIGGTKNGVSSPKGFYGPGNGVSRNMTAPTASVATLPLPFSVRTERGKRFRLPSTAVQENV